MTTCDIAMTAQQVIDSFTSQKISFLGHIVNKYNYQREIRAELCKLAEDGQITPRTYLAALRLTWAVMDKHDKATELEILQP